MGDGTLEYVASNRFVRRGVSVGDVVFPVTVVEGKLRLLGSLKVGRVCDLAVAREELLAKTARRRSSAPTAADREPAGISFNSHTPATVPNTRPTEIAPNPLRSTSWRSR